MRAGRLFQIGLCQFAVNGHALVDPRQAGAADAGLAEELYMDAVLFELLCDGFAGGT